MLAMTDRTLSMISSAVAVQLMGLQSLFQVVMNASMAWGKSFVESNEPRRMDFPGDDAVKDLDLVYPGRTGLSRDSRNCPVAVMKTARWWPRDLPSCGHRSGPGWVRSRRSLLCR